MDFGKEFKSQKFVKMETMCDLNYQDCECFGANVCHCKRKELEMENFFENLHDVASTISEVMILCDLNERKSKMAIDVIIEVLVIYDEFRFRIDSVPRKRLRREYLLHALSDKCEMNRFEAQMTYSIVKRAFMAFYYGTGEGGERNSSYQKQLKHSEECLWVHAAMRTAHVLARYQGMFYKVQKRFEAKLMCVYKKLYDRLQQRILTELHEKCKCENCMRRGQRNRNIHIPKETSNLLLTKSTHSLHSTKAQSPQNLNGMPETDANQHLSDSDSATEAVLPRDKKCNCPDLVCDPFIDKQIVFFSAECSQGAYVCRWLQEYDIADTFTCIPPIPETVLCPENKKGDFECKCACPGECVCSYSDMVGYDEAAEEEGIPREFELDSENDSVEETIYYDLVQLDDRKTDVRFDGCRTIPNDPEIFAKVRKQKMAAEAGLSSASEDWLTTDFTTTETSKHVTGIPSKTTVTTKTSIKTKKTVFVTPSKSAIPETNIKSQTALPIPYANPKKPDINPSPKRNLENQALAQPKPNPPNQQKSKRQSPESQPQKNQPSKPELIQEIENIVGGLI